jgi:hypothetical protein
MTRKRAFVALAVILYGSQLHAASFIIPDDRAFVRRATAIVTATAVESHTVLTERDAIETVTTFTVDEVILGTRMSNGGFEVREPGGTYGDRSTVIPGVPRFTDGQRYALFLAGVGTTWRVVDLTLGKFRFATDVSGHGVLVRDDSEMDGPNGNKPYLENQRRLAAEFLAFLRAEGAAAGAGKQEYFIEREPLLDVASPPRIEGDLRPRSRKTSEVGALIPPYTATSYTFSMGGASAVGARWTVFPNGVNFYSVGTEPGAPGGGTTAINAAFSSWNGEPNSNVNYVYAGTDPGGHTAGLSQSDGANTIMFERNLSAYGVPPFTCSSNGYGGTLGIGGVTSTAGSHAGPNNETFATTTEGDVEMNQGIANCTLLFNNGDFNSAVTHEVGHTLGFRHSDQTRADDPNTACANDASLECSSSAIMKASIPNGLNAVLQLWDQHAVAAVYPSSGGTTPPPAPTGVAAVALTSTSVRITWNPVPNATYQIFRRAPGGAFTQIATSSTNSYTDSTAAANTPYLYRVRAVSAGGTSPDSAADLASTLIFTDDPLTPGLIVRAVHLAQLRTAVNNVRALAGLPAATFTDSAAVGVRIKAVHVNELRTALDAGLAALGFTSGGYTDAITSAVKIKAVHFQELRNRVK